MKILFLSSWFPYPMDTGNKIRVFNLLQSLGLQHEVTLCSFYDPDDIIDREGLQQNCSCNIGKLVPRLPFHPSKIKSIMRFFSPIPRYITSTYSHEMDRYLRSEFENNSYDIFIICHIQNALYGQINRSIKKILEEIELGAAYQKYEKANDFPTKIRAWLTWQKATQYTNRMIRNFDLCTVVSSTELLLLQAPEKVVVVPNGAVLGESREPEPLKLVFNGSIRFYANREAVEYFARKIWPLIKEKEHGVKLFVSGSTEGVDRDGLQSKDIIFTGHINNIRDFVASACVCVIPLLTGGGTRLKILEAMSLGVPVVSTSKGAEGLEVKHEENILIADEPEEFARQVLRLLHDSLLRVRLTTNARRLVQEKYNWKVIGRLFTRLVEDVGGSTIH